MLSGAMGEGSSSKEGSYESVGSKNSPSSVATNIKDELSQEFSFTVEEVEIIEELLLDMQRKRSEVEEFSKENNGVFSSEVFMRAFKSYAEEKEKELVSIVLGDKCLPADDVLKTDISFTFRESLLLDDVRECAVSSYKDPSKALNDKDCIHIDISKYSSSFFNTDNILSPFVGIFSEIVSSNKKASQSLSSLLSEISTLRFYSEDMFETFSFLRK
jgi:hypothetical protein